MDTPEDQRPSHPLVDIVDEVTAFADGERPVLVHALDGFLSAGAGATIAARHLSRQQGPVVASFDLDQLYDYRARRPGIVFDRDHYSAYQAPRLVVRQLHDENERPYLLLSGPEPDYGWEGFAAAVRTVVERFDVSLVVGMGSVPMGVPHTRPVIITTHATDSELVDRANMWQGQLVVPASAQSVLELRLGQWDHQAMGYVAHVPHYLAQVEFPAAAVALLEAVRERTGLVLDISELEIASALAMTQVDQQVAEQEGQELVTGLEEQYDAFSRGAGESLLAAEGPLPTAEELGEQVEEFLAGLDDRD
ncbi:MAG: PAC2 family protein [Actinomycetota bacterium]|nr:PAC2 family protein [Actinomycetota bacterium]